MLTVIRFESEKKNLLEPIKSNGVDTALTQLSKPS